MKYKSIFERVVSDQVLNPFFGSKPNTVSFDLLLAMSGLKKNRAPDSEEQLDFLANLIYTYILARLLLDKDNDYKQLGRWRNYYGRYTTPKMITYGILEKAIEAQFTALFHGELFEVHNKLQALRINEEKITRIINKVYDRLNKKEESQWI